MASLLRPSTRQLARLSTLQTTPRCASRIARPPPAWRQFRLGLNTLPRRAYSTESPQPPSPPEKDSQKKIKPSKAGKAAKDPASGKAADESTSPAQDQAQVKATGTPNEEAPKSEAPKPQLQEGYVWLTEKNIESLQKIIDMAGASKWPEVPKLLETLKSHGAPKELLDLLEKFEGGNLSIGDAMRVLKVMNEVANHVHRVETKQQGGMFSSNQSGEQQGDNKGQQGEQKKDGQQQKQGQGQQKPGSSDFGPGDLLTYAIGAAIFFPIWSLLLGDNSKEITWQELRKNFLDKGLVEKLVVAGGQVKVELNHDAVQAMYPDSVAGKPGFRYYFSIGSVDSFERKLEAAQDELGIPAAQRIPVTYATESLLSSLFMNFGPTLLFVGLLMYMARSSRGGGGVGGGGVFGFSKSKAKRISGENVKVKFADVAGMDEAKVEIMEFVSFLKTPERFQRLGAKIPRGAILSGPPGTGKTLLAKATAGESGVPFYSVSGSEFVEMFVGVGASRVRDLFATARKNSPCIIFIDEIDAIGRARSDSNRGFGGNDEREATLNQILTEMDGFNTSEQVVVLAGTNRQDVLDKALLRPGRFDRHITIDRPTTKGRQEIFKVHMGKIVTSEDVAYLTGRLAALTPGFSGADIANVVNEAALIAARANATTVAMIHFEQAIERVIGGLERKSLVLSPDEKKTVAYHEAGHAICGWYFQWADPLLKVSIIPRGSGALGYAQYLPQGDAYLMNVKQLMDRMAMTLGGRVSEELHFDVVTTGASDDFRKVTAMATHMVTEWGMSEKLGPLSFRNDQNQFQKPFAESTAQTIDAEVRRIVNEAYKQCRDLLMARKHEIGLVAEELLRKEMLDRDDLVRLLGPRPFAEKEEFSKYFDGTRAGPESAAPGGTIAPPPFPAERDGEPGPPPQTGPAEPPKAPEPTTFGNEQRP